MKTVLLLIDIQKDYFSRRQDGIGPAAGGRQESL